MDRMKSGRDKKKFRRWNVLKTRRLTVNVPLRQPNCVQAVTLEWPPYLVLSIWFYHIKMEDIAWKLNPKSAQKILVKSVVRYYCRIHETRQLSIEPQRQNQTSDDLYTYSRRKTNAELPVDTKSISGKCTWNLFFITSTNKKSIWGCKIFVEPKIAPQVGKDPRKRSFIKNKKVKQQQPGN